LVFDDWEVEFFWDLGFGNWKLKNPPVSGFF
jgi:hypothetical protein